MLAMPNWPTQPWYTKLMQMITDYPRLLPVKKDILTHPRRKGSCHPLWQRVHLMACKLSGQLSKSRAFRQKQQTLSSNPEDQLQASNTNHISGNGYSIVIKRSIDPPHSTVGQALEFLFELFKTGLGYSSLNTSRCALSCIITPNNRGSFGSQPLVV